MHNLVLCTEISQLRPAIGKSAGSRIVHLTNVLFGGASSIGYLPDQSRKSPVFTQLRQCRCTRTCTHALRIQRAGNTLETGIQGPRYVHIATSLEILHCFRRNCVHGERGTRTYMMLGRPLNSRLHMLVCILHTKVLFGFFYFFLFCRL